ncbi:glycoside hydrolase family 28 protein [Bacteroides sp.]|uniref:glycoside hydrolase family 28 protein n=1 Tax=Bacteroides sp. TaxID=29523 RepID=UPI0025BACF66|nr:glycosyl hydrolase family 28-related protein [Bacteroides sp.]
MKTNKIRRYSILFFLLPALCISYASVPAFQKDTYDIRKYGAKGDGKTINTKAINATIEDCSSKGGGTVLIPKGKFLTGTIRLKSNITLYLDDEAVLKGTDIVSEYESYIPSKDLSKYDSGEGGDNANSSKDANWNKVLILASGISNFSIEGNGTVDGSHVYDPNGEEKMRGPHTIIIGESKNFSINNITVNCAANYALMAYEIQNAVFHNLEMNEGWDGIHIRGGKNIIIRNCKFQTGDDAIAGGFWENMVITDCYLNTSCNGIRMIMPATGLTISNCTFQGPGKYPHRTSKELRRTNMLSAILLQPGGWGKASGKIEDVHIHDITIDNVNNPFMFILNEGNNANNIITERVKATRINKYASSIESWRGGIFDNVTFRDISIDYVGSDNPVLKNIEIQQPEVDARALPCWGWFINNVRNITFENVNLTYQGNEIRPAFWFDNVANPTFINVTYKEESNNNSIVSIRSGAITKK